MIIHADLMLNGILRIEKYDDRIVLTHPGLLKLPRYRDDGNYDINNLFYS